MKREEKSLNPASTKLLQKNFTPMKKNKKKKNKNKLLKMSLDLNSDLNWDRSLST